MPIDSVTLSDGTLGENAHSAAVIWTGRLKCSALAKSVDIDRSVGAAARSLAAGPRPGGSSRTCCTSPAQGQAFGAPDVAG